MYSAFYRHSKNGGLEVVSTGENGVSVMPAPIRPFFKCLRDDLADVLGVGRAVCNEISAEASDYISLDKRPTYIVNTTIPQQVSEIRERCRQKGLGYKRILEADIPFIRNWMIEKDVRCAPTYPKLYYDIEVWDKDGRPSATNTVYPVISVGAVDHKGNTYCFTAPHGTLEEAKANEKAILAQFRDLVLSKHYGLCVGWWSGGGGTEVSEGQFDYPYLRARYRAHSLDFRVSTVRWLDLVIPFIYTRGHKWKSTSLDYVASSLIGKSKKNKPGSGKVADFTLEQLKDYNVGDEDNPGDAYLTKMIDDAAGDGSALTDLITQIAYETHIFPDEVLYTPNPHIQGPNPSRAIDSLLVEEARRLKYALPSKPDKTEKPEDTGKPKYKGAIIVRDPMPGVHRNVMVFDVESLYPFCVVYKKVSPDPDGLILPNLMMRYIEKKRATSNKVLRNVYKIILNASYGTLGSTYTRIYDTHNAETITLQAREIIRKAADIAANLGYLVIYGDTDSILLELPDDPKDMGLSIQHLGEYITSSLEKELRASYTVEKWPINMPLALFMSELCFTRAAGGERGANKRYSARVTWDAKKGDCDYELTVGLEMIRSDQFSLLEKTQAELLRLKRGGRDAEAAQYMESVREMLFAGMVAAEEFVIGKGFGQETYKSKPPHVRVRDALIAEGLWTGQDTKIHYIWCKGGPKAYIKGVKEPLNVDYGKYWSLLANMAKRADVECVRGEAGSTLDLYST